MLLASTLKINGEMLIIIIILVFFMAGEFGKVLQGTLRGEASAGEVEEVAIKTLKS